MTPIDHVFPDQTTGTVESYNQRKLLILGLDGATWDVLNPLLAEGRMPRLRSLVEAGASGILHSTTPPITPAAWTTFLTGVSPGTHGVIDFERYDPTTNRLLMNSTQAVGHIQNLWTILGNHGLRVGSINVPMTYPATPVRGFLISGFETPGIQSDWCFPRVLKPDLVSHWPDPTLREQWRRRPFQPHRAFAENMAYFSRSFQQGFDMARYCGERFGWDVLMVVLKLVDNLQHKCWKHLDPRWAANSPKKRDMVRRCFQDLDVVIGRFADMAQQHAANLMIVSDHGHGSLEGKIQPNLMLHRWGYLKLRSADQGASRVRSILGSMMGRRRAAGVMTDLSADLSVDFTRTRACVMHAGMAGFLYINLAERQPGGIVSAEEYEPLRTELSKRFLGDACRTTTPHGEVVPLFSAVHKPEELYACSRKEQPWLPDLVLIPHGPLAVVRKIRGRSPVRWLSYRRIEGTHRPEGIVLLHGPGIAKGRKLQAGIIDCAPTALAMLGLPIPPSMEGKLMTAAFDEAPARTSIQRDVSDSSMDDSPSPHVLGNSAVNVAVDQVYSEQELAQVMDRLSDLGYLE